MSTMLSSGIRKPQEALILVGGGGHATVIAEATALGGHALAGFLDDRHDAPLSFGMPGCRRIGSLNQLQLASARPAILAVGDLELRGKLLPILRQVGARPATVIHPSAVVSSFAEVGAGVFLGAMTVVQCRVRIAEHAIINTGAIIDHDCAIGVNSHIAPGAVLGGGVHIGRETLIGLGSRIGPGVEIGDECIVGAGAVVMDTVPDGTTVTGVPAKPRDAESAS